MEPKRILIVDDEAGLTHLLKLALEKTGQYIVQEENDGTAAWHTAREFKPHMIFLDVVMPRIDGGDVASQIRSDPALSKVPVVFLTAIVSQKEAHKQGNAIGGFPFLAKPVTFDALTKCIEQHLGKAVPAK